MAASLVRRLASRFALLACGLAGCAALDDFNWKKMNFDVFVAPSDPMAIVLDPASDGALRARALRAVREPAASGGSQKEQDQCVLALCRAAGHDGNPLCRLAAIESLRRFQDARVVDGLKDAYYRANTFHAETASVIRRQALAGLGGTRQPAAIDLLVRVLREPRTEGADQDRDQKTQERIAAARALANFNTSQATGALADAMAGKDEDIGLQRRCHESLVSITGQELPADAKAWQDMLRAPGAAEAIANRRPTLGEKVLELTGLR